MHNLAAERSLAYHELVSEHLLVDGCILERARARVEQWGKDGSVHPHWVEAWRRWLALTPSQLKSVMLERTDEAASMRQVTPFAGEIDPRTRWRLWRTVREHASVR